MRKVTIKQAIKVNRMLQRMHSRNWIEDYKEARKLKNIQCNNNEE